MEIKSSLFSACISFLYQIKLRASDMGVRIMKKRFSLKNKLIFIFGALIALASLVEGFFAVRIARKAVTEKVESHLIDKAADTSEVIEGRITSFFQFLEGTARMPILADPNVSYAKKMEQLKIEADANDQIIEMNIVDMQGNRHALKARTLPNRVS